MPLALQVISGVREGEIFLLPEGEAATIGRDSVNALCLKDRKLSRIHCQFEVIDNQCQVLDLNSTNGTVVNSEMIESETWIVPDDEVEVGMTKLRLIEISPVEAALASSERQNGTSRAAEAEEGVRCDECNRAISERDLAQGRMRKVGDRHYCVQCVASFDDTIVEVSQIEPPTPPPRPERLRPGTEIAGVRVIAPISEGRLSRLYKGEQINMGRLVAIKMVNVKDKDWAKKYLSAVYTSGQLVHQNIALIFDTGEEDDGCYLIREYVEGESVQAKLAGSRALSMTEAYNIITQVAYAIEYAAERHIFHGELSPQKVLMGERDVVKVTGFGLPQMPPHEMTYEAYRWKALPYTPPERLRKEGTLDFAGDVYSLVAIFYHLVTGRPPFLGSTWEKLEQRILERQPKPLSERVKNAPAAAQKIVNRGLSKDPRSRYQTPHELLYDLEETLRPEI